MSRLDRRRLRRMRACWPTLLSAAPLLLAAASAAAQAPNPAPPGAAASQPADPDSTLPQVRVTAPGAAGTTEGTGSYSAGPSSAATGLTLSIRETPQSVTVVTRERMDDQAAQSIADVLERTTGISIAPTDRGRNSLSARGFSIETYQYDGIPVSTGNIGIETGDADIYDRIEVVRGATGLTTGPGEPSATINLVRKRANSREFSGNVKLRLGSWNERKGVVDLSTPLLADGRVRGRIVASVSRKDAFMDLESTQSRVLYGVVDADLGANTRLGIGASYERIERSGVLWVGLPYFYADGSRTNWSRSKTSATHWNQWDTTEKVIFGTLEHRFASGWRLQGLLQRHQQVENSKLEWMWGDVDRDTGLGLVGTPYHYLAEPRQINAGLTATGPFRAFDRDHELTAGAVYRKSRGGWSNRGAPVVDMPDFNHWDGSLPEPAMSARFQGSYGTTTQNALYTAARLQLADRWKAIVGARLSNWKREEEVGAWRAEASTRRERDVVTPYLGAIYDLSRDWSLYASYTEIFQPQDAVDINLERLDPITGKNYEAGIKGELFDGALNASAAVFRVEQDNVAVQAPTPHPVTNQPYYVAGQGHKVDGYEFELAGDPAPNWNVSLGWTQFKAQDADGADVSTEHPRRLLKLSAKYRFADRLPGFSLGGDLNWRSRQPIWEINPGSQQFERIGQPAFALVDLMARYDLSENLRLQLNVENAFDKTYRAVSFWGNSFTYGEPRKWLLSLESKF